MARPKKIQEVPKEITPDEVNSEKSSEILEEEEPETNPYTVVEINGRKYKRWTDVQGVTFTDPL